MTDITTLRDLERRLVEATGADGTIDALIAVALRAGPPILEPWAYNNFPKWRVTDRNQTLVELDVNGPHFRPDAFTADTDVAAALVDRTLPNWNYGSERTDGVFGACVHEPKAEGEGVFEHAVGASQPIALCLALVRALISQTNEASHD